MKSRPGEKIKLMSVDQLLGVPEGEPIVEIEINRIIEFKDHPFKVIDDEKMKELVESVLGNGILTPVIVRENENECYEMISGHRRLFAAKIIGLSKIPAFVKELTDVEAVIAMVDSNIQRDEILPSEKAFAYKMRYDAMKKTAGRPQKNNLSQNGTNLRSDEELAKQVGESRNQVHRYMRLVYLIPELLELVDKNRIAIMTGVDISYLEDRIQKWLFQYIKENGVIKSYQIIALRQYMEMKEKITQKEMIAVLNENLPGRTPSQKVTLSTKKLNQYFPAYYSSEEIEEIIISLLKQWKKENNN